MLQKSMLQKSDSMIGPSSCLVANADPGSLGLLLSPGPDHGHGRVPGFGLRLQPGTIVIIFEPRNIAQLEKMLLHVCRFHFAVPSFGLPQPWINNYLSGLVWSFTQITHDESSPIGPPGGGLLTS